MKITKSTTKIEKPIFWKMFGIRAVLLVLVIMLLCNVGVGIVEYRYNELLASRNEEGCIELDSEMIKDDLYTYGELSPYTKNIRGVSMILRLYLTGEEYIEGFDKKPICDWRNKVFANFENGWYICNDKDVWQHLSKYALNRFIPIQLWYDEALEGYEEAFNATEADCYYVNRETMEFMPGVIDGKDFTPSDLTNWEKVVDPSTPLVVAPDLPEIDGHTGGGGCAFYIGGERHNHSFVNKGARYEVDFGYWHKKEIILLYSVSWASAIGISLLWAYITYVKRKSVYDVFEYRTNLATKLAHDLKTPLMAISASAENLMVVPEGEKSDLYKKQIVDNVFYMNDMIKSVLKLSESEGARVINLTDNVSVKKALDTCLENLGSVLEQRNLKVSFDGFSDTKIKTDFTILCNAFTCILENAAKYATEGTIITIESSDKSIVSVSNKFEGSIDNVDSLTKPFVRGNDARGEKGGNGLGLAIAKEDLKALSLKLEIKAEGNVFKVIIR